MIIDPEIYPYPSSQETGVSATESHPPHRGGTWRGNGGGDKSLVTERDVHRDFFTSPGGGGGHPTSATQTSDSDTPLLTICRTVADHARFGCSLVFKHVPRGNRFEVRKWIDMVPAYHILHVITKAAFSPFARTRPFPPLPVQPGPVRPSSKLSAAVIKQHFISDLFIGLSIGAMSIPQGMSYAFMAGLPYHYGLYNNLVHPLAYFFFGTSRHAITGVGAVENLMIGESLNTLVGPRVQVEHRLNAAILLSVVSALVFFVFRVTGMAAMADLLADPILSGFATGAAFLVGASQLRHAFGLVNMKSEWGLPKALYYIVTNLQLITLPPLLLCLGSIFVLLASKTITRRLRGRWFIPGPLIVVTVGCVLSYLFNYSEHPTIKVVGEIPKGLPSVIDAIPKFTFVGDASPPEAPLIRCVLLEAVKLSALFFVIHVSVAKTIALRQGYQIEVSEEMTALGMTNLVGSAFGCYPTCTSISRSSVSEGLGAVTGIQGPASSLVVLITLILLTSALSYLPMPCLAAVVLVGVSSMFAEFGQFCRLWKLQKASYHAAPSGQGGSSPDLLLWGVTFVFTLCLGATEGILISVALSLIWIGKCILRPSFVELGRIPGTMIYRDRRRFSHIVKINPNVAIFRIDAPLNFCNSGFLERAIRDVIKTRFVPVERPLEEPTTPPTQHQIIAVNPVRELRARSPDPFRSLSSPRSELTLSPEIPQPPSRVYLEIMGSPLDHSGERRPQTEQVRRKPPFDIESSAARHPPNIFILDCSSINGLDVTAIAAIERIVKNAMEYGVIVAFSNWKGPQRDFLYRANFYDVVPPQRCFMSNHDAYIWATALRSSYTGVVPPPQDVTNRPQTSLPTSAASHRRISNDFAGRTYEAMSIKTVPDEHLEEIGEVWEWDGLSALVPNVRIVHEITSEGRRRWEVSAAAEIDSGGVMATSSSFAG